LQDEKPTVARFAVNCQIPQRLTSALPLAERIHLALVSLSDGAKVFTGCDGEGWPLQWQRHAHILCIWICPRRQSFSMTGTIFWRPCWIWSGNN